MVLPPEPLVGLPVHPLGLLREWLHHVRAPSETLPDGLRLVEGSVHLVIPLALVDEIVAVTTQEVAPRSVKESYPPAASRARTDEPRPLPSEVARSPAQGHRLTYLFPFSAWTAPVPVCQDYPLRLLVPYHRTADGARLPVSPRPAQREPAPWLQQAFPVEISHVHAMTLAGRGLLVEPVPVAATYAAHNFLLSFCRNHKASCTTPEWHFSELVHFTRTLRLVGVANLRTVGQGCCSFYRKDERH